MFTFCVPEPRNKIKFCLSSTLRHKLWNIPNKQVIISHDRQDFDQDRWKWASVSLTPRRKRERNIKHIRCIFSADDASENAKRKSQRVTLLQSSSQNADLFSRCYADVYAIVLEDADRSAWLSCHIRLKGGVRIAGRGEGHS